ncbi:Cys-rich peptide radical SAM maturase CcpM [Petralouisia muris]|uniref:Cys-rich peptide radical SAM maturase CcpM n=1 Tax=Petralouisia muris TaxID=3032872 RepID=UPI0014426432|nr:Cys-rich peptide radical SAM maturase CcpM [Petralouisia muris]
MESTIKKLNCHLFRVCGKYYVYDVPKNVILKVNRDTYNEIKELSIEEQSDYKGDNNTIKELLSEGYLSSQYIEKIEHPMTRNIESALDNSLHMLTLQVTQNCNLRCKYCVYSGSYINRKHNNKRMSFETAKKAIDYYILHSSQMPKLRFGFYGGEPTLEIELIRKCVSYINGCSLGKPVEYNLTTNATILNRDIIQFFIDNHFYLTISLDGSKEIQDKNRVYAESGKGTFDKVIENIGWLRKEFPDFLQRVHFNMVMDPVDGYSISNDFFMKDERVKGIEVNASQKNDVNYTEEIAKTPEYYMNRSYEQFKVIFDYYRDIKEDISPLVTGYLGGIKNNIADMLKGDESGYKIGHPGGPCVPGLQRLFVNADGNFYPCERTNEDSAMMIIGNVEDGIDIDKAKTLLNVGKISENVCKKCWAFRFCTSCAVYAEDKDKLSTEKRLSRCDSIRSAVETNFREYCILKELKMDFEELEETD